jgi:hypothetical protein
MPGTLINQPKAEIIAHLFASRKENTCQTLIKLIDMMVNEFRVDNDTAEGNVVLKNQGAIEVLNDLKDKIERGQPNMIKTA